MMTHFGDMELFLSCQSDVAPATMRKLVALLTDKKDMLMMELAAVIDVGEPLVKTTYDLEGDGPLALNCYNVMTTVLTSVRTGYYPNVKVVSRRLSNGNDQLCQRWVRYAMDCVEPGLEYFADAVSGPFTNSM